MLDFQGIQHQSGFTIGQEKGIRHRVAGRVSLGIDLVPFKNIVPDRLSVFNINVFSGGILYS